MASKPNSAKATAGSTRSTKRGRTSDSGKFVVAKPVTTSHRFTAADLKKAVRTVITASKGSPRS